MKPPFRCLLFSPSLNLLFATSSMAPNSSFHLAWQEAAVPDIVNQKARDYPESVYGVWPIDPQSYSSGVRAITYAQLNNIVNGLAWYLSERLNGTKDNEILAYVGPNDVRFTALLLAAIKIGPGVYFAVNLLCLSIG
jgi:acyl-CoA synthetase (AMP-forming)/AMP-acid ligase II